MTNRITDLANLDLGEIHDYIFQRSPRHSIQTLFRFESIFLLLTDSPLMGTLRDELFLGIRSHPVGNYVIFYHLEDSFVVIDRVLNSSRDIESIFNPN